MDSGTLIHAAFEARAAAHPEALAISSEQGQLSYGRLDALTRHFAARIDAMAPTGAVVAILAERGSHVVVAALACARAGRPFAILDRAYPAQRLGALIDICRPSLILAASVDAPAGQPGAAPPTLAIDLEPDALAAFEPREISPDAPAYLLFTSGSTGAPKCVACSHRPLTHFVAWQAATFALTADDRFTMLSGLSHDPVLRDVFTPLSLGASIHIPSQATLTAPGGLFDWASRAEDRTRLWQARHDAYWAARALRQGGQAVASDVCVPISRLAECVIETQRDIEQSRLVAPILGHVGDGNFHLSLVVDLDDADEVKRAKGLLERLVERALAMDGTCTGEHGVGQGKMKYLLAERGEPALASMRAIKHALDPLDIMNPGKIVAA